MLNLLRTAAAAALLAAPALADDAVLYNTREAASLHVGPIDMLMTYAPAPGERMEVTAYFAPRTVQVMSAGPVRMVLGLRDGEVAEYAVPGYPQVLYRFGREGDAVTVRALLAGTEVAGL